MNEKNEQKEEMTKPAPSNLLFDAVFEERDTYGVLLWRVISSRVLDKGRILECDSITLEVTNAGSKALGRRGSAGEERFVNRPYNADETAPVSIYARGRKGTMISFTDTRLVEISDDVEIIMDNGWKVVGTSIRWDGKLIVSDKPVTIVRTGMIVHGTEAVIEVEKNRFFLKNVSGKFEGVRM